MPQPLPYLNMKTIEGKHVHEILEQGKIVSEIVKSTPDIPEDNKSEKDGTTSEEDDKAEDMGD